ncbi:alginate export family protein [Candidatus Calescamantes bacterium]|nr:alginate export family protein [Candidatus Calescamantes bacterium]
MGSRIKLIVLAFVLFAGYSLALNAEVQNVRVGGDIEVRGIWQKDVDLIAEDWSPKVSNFLYQCTRVYVSADLTDNVNAYVRFLNDRFWGTDAKAGETGSEVDVDLAYLTLAEMFGFPMSLTIGRQELSYGEGFLVGDGVSDVYIISGVNTFAYVYGPKKAFDAIKFSYSYENSTVDMIKAKLSEGYGQGTDENLYGINWNLKTDTYGTWDFAVFAKFQNPTTKGRNETVAFSIRGAGEIPQVTVGKLEVKGELVKETGKVDAVSSGTGDTEKLEAWGGYLGVKYTFDNPYEPYINLCYTRMTGDKANTDRIESFDPLYQDEKYGEIAYALLYSGAAYNAKIFQAGLGFKPNEKVGVDLTYYNFDEDQHVTGGSSTDNRNLGKEWDLLISYDYTEDVQFGLCYAVFIPGKAITEALDDLDIDEAKASALLGTVKVTF